MSRSFLSLFLLLFSVGVFAHPFEGKGSSASHKSEMYAVFGFEHNPNIDIWFKHISAAMIDGLYGNSKSIPVRPEYGNRTFYNYLKDNFPGFQCTHRYMFHWGYNATPWSDALAKKIKSCSWSNDAQKVAQFKEAIKKEQQLRNKEANELTEKTFGFSSGGYEAKYANAMISIAYDVHLIGDYMSDNKKLDGLAPFSSVVGDIINAIEKLDKKEGQQLIKALKKESARQISDQQKADNIMLLLQKEFPTFIKKANNGYIVTKCKQKGISFK